MLPRILRRPRIILCLGLPCAKVGWVARVLLPCPKEGRCEGSLSGGCRSGGSGAKEGWVPRVFLFLSLSCGCRSGGSGAKEGWVGRVPYVDDPNTPEETFLIQY
ncbi:uncharacterized protein LOC121992306 isoform X1 [Zingiber officinale]|uniref:uncharacterized protein LOC121992306 isoform X1 n=1 Tax=Zingiber officinale TaxID=94328 RepID=UPI001C4DC40A|nr:uncharacterized protein LOC121992306 isoform X1 [Zingiber officinale]